MNVEKLLKSGMTIEQAVTESLILNKGKKNQTLSIPKDTYIISGKDLQDSGLYVTNHDHCVKPVFLHIKNQHKLTIDGNGSEFIFMGRIMPVEISNSSDIILKNFSIDYKRPFFTQGKVLYADSTMVTLSIDREKYPFKMKNGRLVFFGNDFESKTILQFTEFDEKTKSPNYASKDNFFKTKPIWGEENEDATVSFYGDLDYVHQVGKTIVIKNDRRYIPGIVLSESKNIFIEDITVYQAGAMASVAQVCENITYRRFNVITKPHTDRLVSANADATHFVNCTGKVELIDCKLESMLDDGTNIHGAYIVVRNIYSDSLDASIGHFQQFGVNIFKSGDVVTVLDPKNAKRKATCKIKNAYLVNKDTVKIRFEDGITGVAIGDLLENPDRMPEIYISGCHIGKNRARGLLLSSSQKTVVENNTIYSSGAAINIGATLSHWHESGAVTDVLIKNNIFDNSGYATWGLAIISVACNNEVSDISYNKNIVIDNNVFKSFDTPLLAVNDTENIEFTNNSIQKTTAYMPFKNPKERGFSNYMEVIKDFGIFYSDEVKNIIVQGNKKIK